MREYWTCVGDVRGDCGVKHRSLASAEACCDRDHAGCKTQGGYSDRSPEERTPPPKSEPVTRYAIVTFDPGCQGWFVSRAQPPQSERDFKVGRERLLSDNSHETIDISWLTGAAPLPRKGFPSQRVEHAVRHALKLQKQRGVDFRKRADPGNPWQIEGWDVVWQQSV